MMTRAIVTLFVTLKHLIAVYLNEDHILVAPACSREHLGTIHDEKYAGVPINSASKGA